MAGGWLNQWPWLRFIAPNWTGYNVIQKMNKELSHIIEESINKHKNKLVKGSDFIYTFLDEIYNQKQTYTEDQLKGICLDFLIASTQTTGNSFGFMILALVRYPDMQEKVYQEITTIFGEDNPDWSDLGRLVYTNAFLAESQRYHTIALFSGARRTLTDVVVDGYTIPSGTTVLVSLGDLHSDPKHWDEPNKFNPERFIDENGKFRMAPHFHPFGLGRRRCPGEPLSRPFLISALVTIVQRYRIECSNGVLPSEEPIVGILAEPRPFSARFIRRK
ncbi:unnamed protein product [Euphydryas editha]|nr:unnamed protein product [Euphydryas editha]